MFFIGFTFIFGSAFVGYGFGRYSGLSILSILAIVTWIIGGYYYSYISRNSSNFAEFWNDGGWKMLVIIGGFTLIGWILGILFRMIRRKNIL